MNILDEIFAYKQVEVAEAKRARPLNQVRREAETAAPVLDFIAALRAARRFPVGPELHSAGSLPATRGSEDRAQAAGSTRYSPALIAEVKRASPSRGLLVRDFDPLRLARIFIENGAAAISVLTDERYFQGRLDYLRQIALLSDRVPLLRKDFTCDDYQVYEARAAGADAMLLIAAYLEAGRLRELHALIRELGMAALVEVHSRAELEAVLPLEPPLVGINNRNLKDFSMNLETTFELRPLVPAGACVVAESGIHTAQDCARMAAAGIDAVLVGEALVAADDIAAKVRGLAGMTGKEEHQP
jgi:indole-3-glycerol phosphate synthase